MGSITILVFFEAQLGTKGPHPAGLRIWGFRFVVLGCSDHCLRFGVQGLRFRGCVLELSIGVWDLKLLVCSRCRNGKLSQ